MNNKLQTTVNNWEKRIKKIADNTSKGIATRGNDGSILVSDIANYIATINLLKKNDFLNAYRKIVRMDTDARDNIPASIYNYLLERDFS